MTPDDKEGAHEKGTIPEWLLALTIFKEQPYLFTAESHITMAYFPLNISLSNLN